MASRKEHLKISIASGKGGTGKTTLALLLAIAQPQVTLIDCDVEEPNCHLFLQPDFQKEKQDVTVMVPHINAEHCTGCGKCTVVCLFNAIAVAGKTTLLFDELCHSCGGCLLACTNGAIVEEQKSIGTLATGRSTIFSHTMLLNGTLHVGLPTAIPLIKALKKQIPLLIGDVIIDCPPGTSCSMVTAIKDSDCCILVTEPTPFGRHDLELAMNIVELLHIPVGVVINKSDQGSGDLDIESLCQSRQIPVLGKIPHSLTFASQYAAGIITNEFLAITTDIWQQVDTLGRSTVL